MRFKKGFAFTFIALLAVCGFLLDVGAAVAAGERIQGKDPNGPAIRSERFMSSQSGKPSFFATGEVKGGQSPLPFLKEFTEATCQSGCCWASGCNVSCSETRCFASCGSETSEYTCSANAQ